MHAIRMRSAGAFLALALALAVQPAGSAAAAAAAPADQPELRLLAEQLVSAYARKDLDAYQRLWSQRSPEAAPGDQRRLFAERPALVVRSTEVTVAALTAEAATLRVRAEAVPAEAANDAPRAPQTLRRL